MLLPNYQSVDVREEFNTIKEIIESFGNLFTEQDRENLYQHLVDAFGGIRRRDGTPYLNHLAHTFQNFIEHFPEEISRISILVALLHDSIEDTPETFESLREKFGLEVAIGVSILSKKKKNDIFLISEKGRNIEYYTRFSGGISSLAEFIQGELLKQPKDIEMQKMIENHYMYMNAKNKKGASDKNNSPSGLIRLARIIAQVKLCDRLHNLQTLENQDKKKEQYIETQKLKRIINEIGGTIKEKINHNLNIIFSSFSEAIQKQVKNIIDTK